MSETLQTSEQSAAERMAAARAARQAKQDATVTEPVTVEAAPSEPGLELPAGPTILERAAANEEEKRLAKITALRAAKVRSSDPVAEPEVRVRVLKRGGGLISMGEHISGLGDLTYDAGETPTMPLSIAQALEDRGLVEID